MQNKTDLSNLPFTSQVPCRLRFSADRVTAQKTEASFPPVILMLPLRGKRTPGDLSKVDIGPSMQRSNRESYNRVAFGHKNAGPSEVGAVFQGGTSSQKKHPKMFGRNQFPYSSNVEFSNILLSLFRSYYVCNEL